MYAPQSKTSHTSRCAPARAARSKRPWDRDRWALNPTLTDDDTCEQLNLVVGLVEDPLAHTVDEAERAGRFLREDNGYLAVPLAGPIVDRRIEMALARSLIGEAFAAEDERARLAEGVHDPTVTRPGAALRAFAEAFMPGWPEGTGVEDPTGQPRSTRPELQTTLEPGEVRPWPDDNCVATRAQDSKSVTRTVTVSGQAGSQAAKDRLYAIQREMDSLELQLQRLGERRQVTDYLVERDGTVRSGLVTQDSPQHDHLERKLAELRAEQGQLMEAAIGTLPTERTITEQVKGDVYEQMVCTGRALQGGTLAVGNDTMPVDRTRRETLSARRAPGDAAAMARLNDAATAAALANIGEAEWDLLGGMRVLDWMAIDRWILSRGLQNQWTPEERESERQFLRDHYHPRAGNQAD
ncbi:MAG: hypothetical protein H6738_18160 [Alphaproteobacteria bacterium]|nr:hypothetical protein [Alphaproteobacteria bacterium]